MVLNHAIGVSSLAHPCRNGFLRIWSMVVVDLEKLNGESFWVVYMVFVELEEQDVVVTNFCSFQ